MIVPTRKSCQEKNIIIVHHNETLPFLQPAEIQWMYICQKCLVGFIFDSKMEFAVINTSNTGIFTSNDWQKYIQYCQKHIQYCQKHIQYCQKHIHLMPNLHLGFLILPKIQPYFY